MAGPMEQAMTGLEARILPTGRGAVHYGVAGAGEPVVLLHGATADHGMWAPQVGPLSEHHRLIVPDLPAHGRSRPYAPFTLENCARDALAILDREGLGRAHIVGQSMGGYVAQVMALEHPDRVASVVAVDSSPFDATYYSRMDRWLLGMTPTLLKGFPSGMLKRSIAHGVSTTEAGRAYMRKVLEGQTKREVVDIMDAVYRGLLQYAYRRFRLACPVFIIFGEKDATGRVIAYSKRWAEEEGHPVGSG
jgi:pimeloyl-ACP methyl ester carboxylesterase